MAGSQAPIFEAVPRCDAVTFTSSDTTTTKAILAAGTNGTRIDGIIITSNDTAAVNLQCYAYNGTTDFYIGVVAVPIGAGYTTVARVDGLAVLAPAQTGALILPTGYSLRMACLATMTAAKTVTVTIQGGDY